MRWPSVGLGEICKPKQWKNISTKDFTTSGYSVYGANGKIGFFHEFTHEEPVILVACRGATCGAINVTEPYSYANSNAMALDSIDTTKIDLRYLAKYLGFRGFQDVVSGSAQPQITSENIAKVEVLLPPLEEQRRIAAILDKRHSLEEKIQRRGLLQEDLWKAEFVKRFGNPFAHQSPYHLLKLGELASTSSGGTPRREVGSFFGGSIPWVKSGELSNPIVESTEEFLTEEGLDNSSAKILNPGVVLLAMYGATAGAVSILGIQASTNQAICAIDAHDRLDSIYLADYLRLIAPALLAKRIGGAQPNLTQDIIRNILIPVPDEDSLRSYASFRRQMAKVEVCFPGSLLAVSRLGASFSKRAFALDPGLR